MPDIPARQKRAHKAARNFFSWECNPCLLYTSVFAQWGGDESVLDNVALSPLVSSHENALLTKLADYPDILARAQDELSPHLIAFYLRELAGELHGYYNAERFLVDDEPTKLARLALLKATRQVLHNGLALLGVSAPVKM